MAENKANKAAQEPQKEVKGYKVTCGTFKARNEAMQRAAAQDAQGNYNVAERAYSGGSSGSFRPVRKKIRKEI